MCDFCARALSCRHSNLLQFIDGRFVSKPGHNCRYDCAHEGCETKRCVYHDNQAGCCRVREVGLCEHNTRSAYMQSTALHLPLAMTLKLQDLLGGKCPRRALALMREAFPGDPLVSKMTTRWITNWSRRRVPPSPSTKGNRREKGSSFAGGAMQRGHLNGSYIMREFCEVGY